MSYTLSGRVKEVKCFLNGNNVEKYQVRLIPNEEYTLKHGSKKICIMLDSNSQNAQYLEYDEFLEFELAEKRFLSLMLICHNMILTMEDEFLEFELAEKRFLPLMLICHNKILTMEFEIMSTGTENVDTKAKASDPELNITLKSDKTKTNMKGISLTLQSIGIAQ